MHYYCKHMLLSWYPVLSLFSICAFFSFSCLKYLCAGFTCMCMPWRPATFKYKGARARFRQKSHSYSVDRTPIFFICSVIRHLRSKNMAKVYPKSWFWMHAFDWPVQILNTQNLHAILYVLKLPVTMTCAVLCSQTYLGCIPQLFATF